MPDFLQGLDPAFRETLKKTLAHCATRGVTMVPYFGVRTPFQQGALWRQSRSVDQVHGKIADLKEKGATFLAHCIESVGPQHGPPVTNAIPGYSWHQWGEAMDCYWLHNGEAQWSPDVLGIKNGYRIYADQASKDGLTAGGYWQSIKDWPHVQQRAAGSPVDAGYSLLEIDARMKEHFG
jgi:peptidoglycan L-alanyl-D-glutamate endopeptidase CwlK